jgi:hypothetical protein
MTVPAQRVEEFDTWQPGYGGASVEVVRANTTTRVALYLDSGLTLPADNPQILESQDSDGVYYGKFSQPVYTNEPYSLIIDGTDQTGIVRPPVTDLSDEPAGYATSQTARSLRERRLLDRFDDDIRAEDFGEIGTSSATNTATLNAAIGAAAGQGGGRVLLPAVSITITTLILSAGVVLVGAGRGVTTLVSQEGQAVITTSGEGAGLEHLTLDGVTLVSGSIGFYAESMDRRILNDVEIKRFDTGLKALGGTKNTWKDLFVTNCATGADLDGDTDPGGGGTGDEWASNEWSGGVVSQCTVAGVKMNFVDTYVRHNTLRQIGLESNTGIALQINGARFTRAENCWWAGNATNLDVADDSDVSLVLQNTVKGLYISGGYMNAGTVNFDGTCLDVEFRGMDLVDVDFVLSLPDNPIVLRDCFEDAQVTIAGDTDKFTRVSSFNENEAAGVTTDANAITGWSYGLDPGELLQVEAKVLANQRDGIDAGSYHISTVVRRPGATLNYDNQTGNFTVGTLLTGATSGATARIVADSDAGAAGTLTLRDIVGVFEDNEIIADSASGSAQANGNVTGQDTGFLWGQLAYDAQTANFTAGQVVTGSTSGAKGTILSDADGGTTGTLTLRDITGTFADNEAITDPLGGAAVVNGILTGHQTAIETARETDTNLDAAFDCLGNEVRVRVTGIAAEVWEWQIRTVRFTA